MNGLDENNLGHNKPVVEATRHKLLTLRWNEPVYLSGAGTATTTTAFIRLLSYSLIDGNLIDMMFAYLSDRAERDPTLDNFAIIETLRFMYDINIAASADDHKKPLTPLLQRLEERIKETESDVLIFPVHFSEQKHWLTFKIDFTNAEISYGKALHADTIWFTNLTSFQATRYLIMACCLPKMPSKSSCVRKQEVLQHTMQTLMMIYHKYIVVLA